MTGKPTESFPPEIARRLKTYVYRLIDPRNGETFYIRSAWVLKKSKAEQAEVILATVQGEIKGAFVARRWLEVTAENFPDRDPIPGRFGFEGEEAPDEIKTLYVGKRVPDEYRRPGAANLIKYTW